eukprot:COSAG02_NODE_11903_length_1632_cov_1.981735_1_plen_425_part_00
MNETSRVPAGAVSLAWLADRLVQFGVWMLDEAKAMNDKADRVDRTVVNAHQVSEVAIGAHTRLPNPETGLVDSAAVDGSHCEHGRRRDLVQTHHVALRMGVASGQCAAYALGMRRPALFHLRGPVVDGAERLYTEAEANCMLLSPAVEDMISKSVSGLVRVPLKFDKVAQTEEERAALEAEKELEDVVEAQRALEQARKGGNIELIRKAEQRLLREQDEADEAVIAAAAAKERAEAERKKKLGEMEVARQARIDAATGPKYYQFGWRNGRRNTDGLTPQQVGKVDARRRLMAHRPKDSPSAQSPKRRTGARPSTAPAVVLSGVSDGSASEQISDREELQERQQNRVRTTQLHSLSRQSETVGSPMSDAQAVPFSTSAIPNVRRPRSARPVLQSHTSTVLQLSWQAPPGIGRPGSAFAASTAAGR